MSKSPIMCACPELTPHCVALWACDSGHSLLVYIFGRNVNGLLVNTEFAWKHYMFLISNCFRVVSSLCSSCYCWQSVVISSSWFPLSVKHCLLHWLRISKHMHINGHVSWPEFGVCLKIYLTNPHSISVKWYQIFFTLAQDVADETRQLCLVAGSRWDHSDHSVLWTLQRTGRQWLHHDK